MTRVAVFGLGPMRWEASDRLFALPLRTWHVAGALARRGHAVTLFAMRTAAFEGWDAQKTTCVVHDGVTVVSVSEHALKERPAEIEALLRERAPECVIGVNRDPAAAAVRYVGELPFWADVNGDPMAEAQAKADVEDSDRFTPEFHRGLVRILARADRFSTCSRMQRAALIGQLGMIGRLRKETAHLDWVHAIANSLDDAELRTLGAIERAPRTAGEPFRLLSSGGFNTWMDPELLFEVVERAMAREPALELIVIGGPIGGHYEAGWNAFRARVASSPHEARYRLRGWVDTEELPSVYASAHAAILTDRFGYEGLLGARTRMLDWVAAGLPIVSTRLSEISEDLERKGACLASPCGDAEAMTENLLRLVREPALAAAMGAKGRRVAEMELRADVQLAPLLAWAERPVRAPDRGVRISFDDPDAKTAELRSLARQFVHKTRREGLYASLGDARRYAGRRARQLTSPSPRAPTPHVSPRDAQLLGRLPLYSAFRALGRPIVGPLAMSFVLTDKCNSRCKTCLIGARYLDDPSVAEGELTTAELERVIATIGPLAWVTLSGGEPFMRKDLADVAVALAEACDPRVINIPTNGTLVAGTTRAVASILERTRRVHLVVNVSVDGIGAEHDTLRGFEGNFERLRTLIAELRRLDASRLTIGCNTVVSAFNAERIEAIVDGVLAQLAPDSYVLEIAQHRPEYHNDLVTLRPAKPSRDRVERAVERALAPSRRGVPGLVRAFRRAYYDDALASLDGPRPHVCYSGFASCAVMPKGDVVTSTGRADPMGSLRDYDLDFAALWRGPEAERARLAVRSELCRCESSNASYTNALLDPRRAGRALWRALRSE
ncbi:MAG: glycosyltransferase [Sandaracinaceae bacterium]